MNATPNCVRDFLGSDPITPEKLAQLMEQWYLAEYRPDVRDLKKRASQNDTSIQAVRADIADLKETITEWRGSLRTVIYIGAALGGLISAIGTIIGIYTAFH